MRGTTKIKQILRERISKLLRNQKEEDRLRKSLGVQKKLFKLKEFKRAKTILFYASFDGEVETLRMIKQAIKLGKRIGLPKILGDKKKFIPVVVHNVDKDLAKGYAGILEPAQTHQRALSLNDIDMVIVPGLAFDKLNFRLGRGAGYYDRFLKRLPSHIPTIGLAFDFQLLNRLPRQRHDIPLYRVLAN